MSDVVRMAGWLAAGLFWIGQAGADIVHTRDGSTLQGEIAGLDDGELTLETTFAGTVTVDQAEVAGLETEAPVVVRLDNGDEVTARLLYESDNDWTSLDNPNFGDAPLALENLVHLRRPGEDSPEQILAQTRLAEAEARAAALEDPWSGRLQVGIQGSQGNSETQSNAIRAEALRDTGRERLSLAIQRNKESQDDEDTRDETRATARLERDWTERFFLFGETEAEKDEFEEIDLRVRAVIGPGYFLIRRPGHEYKLRMGLGYEHVDYVEGDSESNIISTFGWDYRYDWLPWARLTHTLTLIPEIDNQPADNFRADSRLGAEFPLGTRESLWTLRGELAHEYENQPEPGVEELDTSYLLSVIRDFE